MRVTWARIPPFGPPEGTTRVAHPQPGSRADRRTPATRQPRSSRSTSYRHEEPTGQSLVSRSHAPHTGWWATMSGAHLFPFLRSPLRNARREIAGVGRPRTSPRCITARP
jgi:hypothetical protein